MTRHLVFLGALALFTVLVGCNSCVHEPKGAKKLPMPTGTPKRPQGLTAITPSPGPQPFTAADVETYVKTHRLAHSIGDPSQIKVDSLEFITARDASTRLSGAKTGLGDDERVGFAVISGPMVFTGPPPGKPVQFIRGYVIFDAVSGNLLMSGTLERAKGDNRTPETPK
jgi:hypothetical protein